MAISYVGGQVGGRAGSTSTGNVTFALTGGSNSTPQAGDLVVIGVTVASQGRTPACAVSGYTAQTQINANGTTYDTSLNVSYKWMGETPDTTFTLPSTGNIADAQRYTVQVWRGVDTGTPLDVAMVSASGTGTGRPNPGGITPTTSGAYVGIIGAGAAGTGASYTAPANYTTNFLTGSTADTNDAMIGSGYRAWTSGAEDPADYTGGTTNAADSWAAFTYALRPSAGPVTHDTTGALTGQGSSVVGAALHLVPGGNVIQNAYNADDSGSSSTTISASLSGVQAGSTIVAFVGWSNFAGTPTCSVSDGTAYTAAADGSLLQSTDAQFSQVFYLPNAASGSHTVTATFSATTGYRRIRLFEVAGVATSSVEDGAAHQQQNTVGTTTNSISSSATATTSNANDFVLGMTQDTSSVDPGSGTMAAGTGYTLIGTNQILAGEYKNVSSTGTQTATFTDSKNSHRTTHVLVLKTLLSGPITHATTGALTGQGAAVAGAATRFRAHDATGGLTGAGAAITGSAARSAGAVTHDTSGTLAGQGTELAGAASRFRTFSASGALVGQGSTITGSGARYRAMATSGALTGQGAAVAGTARHNTPHATSGVLAGSGASLTGTAARTRDHQASGSLAGAGSTVSGTAQYNSTHATSGALVGQGSTVSGNAQRNSTHGTTGVLTGPGAVVVGAASRNATVVTHDTAGALVGPGSALSGSANRYRQHDSSGALAGPGSTVAGASNRFRAHDSTGSVISDSNTITAASMVRLAEIWARMELDAANPLVTSATQLTVGTISQDISTGGAVRTGATMVPTIDPDTMIAEVWQRLGLDPDNALTQTNASIDVGNIHLTVSGTDTLTVQRV